MSPTIAHLIVVLISTVPRLVAGQDSISLPSLLLDRTPPCARACLAAFVQQNLWGCPKASDLDCLCQTPGANGYTLGEGALACVADVCPFDYVGRYSSVYDVCAGRENAVRATHSIVSAVIATATIDFAQDRSSTSSLTSSSTSSRTAPSTRATSSTRFSTKRTSKTSTTLTSTSTTTFKSSTFLTTSTSTPMTSLELDSSTPPPPASPTWSASPSTGPSLTQNGAKATATEAAAHQVLKPGQVAGIAVAGVFLGAAVIGILLFIFCGKKHRRQRKGDQDEDAARNRSQQDPERGGSNGSDFVEIKPDTPLISIPPVPPRSRQGGSKAHQFFGLPAAPNQHRQSWWNKFGRKSIPQPGPPVPSKPSSQIGMARFLTPTMGGVSSEVSPKSTASYHTTSNLLPDKPAYQPGGLQVHEKRCSEETAANQPVLLGAGVGLRIVSATPEPGQRRQLGNGWSQTDTSQRALQEQYPVDQGALKGKLSDPFIARTHDETQEQAGLAPAFRASRNQLPRINTFGERDADNAGSNQVYHSARRQSAAGIPNFRNLINPQAPASAEPPQLPEADALSPLTPGFVAANVLSQRGGHQDQHSIMNRPRGASSSPFFSSQPSQYFAYQQPRRERKKLRPETHYTTSSETEFEDDDPSPMTPFAHNPSSFKPLQNVPKTHVSIGGVAELPALSPVTESPASKKTPSSGRSAPGWAAKTPSPQIHGTPASRSMRSDDGDLDKSTLSAPLSQIRYPEIPGSRASPKREIKTVNIALGMPREVKALHIGQLQEASASPPPGRLAANSRDDAGYESDNDHLFPKKTRSPKLQPSPLRPSKAQNNLRDVAAAQSPSRMAKVSPLSEPSPLQSPYQTPPREIDQPEIAELPSPSELKPVAKFHSAASRLAVSSAGLRSHHSDERGLGNWPVQPVRPVTNLRNTKIPAPVGMPASAGSQPATPVTDGKPVSDDSNQPFDNVHGLALSKSNDGPFQVAGSLFQTSHQGHNANEGRVRSSGRVLIAGPNGRAMHTPVLSPTQIPAPVTTSERMLQAAVEPQHSFSQLSQSHRSAGVSHAAPEATPIEGWGNLSRFVHARNLSQGRFAQLSHEESYRPSADFSSFQRQQQPSVLNSNFQDQQVVGRYEGPRLSMGPNRYSKAPSRETEREREVRVGLAKLREWEQERRQVIETEAHNARVGIEREMNYLRSG